MEKRFTYVVLAHMEPAQVLRLLRAIRRMSPNSGVVLHWNPTFEAPPADLPEGVQLVAHPLRPRWGHWSLTAAALRGFSQARQVFDPDWVVLLSGSDYPIRHLSEWEAELVAAGVDAQMTDREAAMHAPGWGRPVVAEDDTYLRYHYRWWWLPRGLLQPALPPRALRLWQRTAYGLTNRVQPVLAVRETPDATVLGIRRLRHRGMPSDVRYGGMWVALRRNALEQLVQDPRARAMAQAYQQSLLADESFFQTAAHLLGWRLRRRPVSASLHYPPQPRPELLRLADLDDLLETGAPFARKVDPRVSAELLDELDERLALAPASPDAQGSSR